MHRGYPAITETCDDAPLCSCRATAAARPAAEGAVTGGRGHDKTCAHLVFPNLITHVATTDATVTDNQMTGAIHDDLAGTNLVPGRHYLDSGYLSAAVVAAGHARHGIALIGPLLADTSAQARAGQGYARADFTVDYDTKTVTCPQGKTARSWSPCTQHGKHAIVAIFSTTDGAGGDRAPEVADPVRRPPGASRPIRPLGRSDRRSPPGGGRAGLRYGDLCERHLTHGYSVEQSSDGRVNVLRDGGLISLHSSGGPSDVAGIGQAGYLRP